MPAIIAALVGALASVLMSVLIWVFKKILIALGIGMVAYVGVQALVDWVLRQIVAAIPYGDEYNLVAWLGILRFGECLSIVLSAVSLGLVMRYKNRVEMQIMADQKARDFIT